MRTARSARTAAFRPPRSAASTATSRPRPIIAEQDAEIAEKSGQPRGPIKSIRRAGEPEPRSLQKSERVAQR